jgi:hypothetical protein
VELHANILYPDIVDEDKRCEIQAEILRGTDEIGMWLMGFSLPADCLVLVRNKLSELVETVADFQELTELNFNDLKKFIRALGMAESEKQRLVEGCQSAWRPSAETKAELDLQHKDADASYETKFMLSSPRATEIVVMVLVRPIDVEGLHSSAIVAICKLAFCFHFKEPCILRGPTCFKSHCVRTLVDAMDIANSSRKLNTLYLSQLSEHNDLVGGIEPHTKQSFSEYIASLLPMVASVMPDSQHAPAFEVGQVLKQLRLLAHDSSAPATVKKWCADRLFQLENDFAPQGFPFCERGIVSSVRHGGVLLLKDLNLPDQAVVESLNSLTELCPSFRSGPANEQVAIHDQFHVVATVHEPSTLNPLSPAMLSRFTEIRIEPPTTSDIAGFQEAWSPLLTRYMRSKYAKAMTEDEFSLLADLPTAEHAHNSLADFMEYMFGLLSVIQKCMPSVLKQVTLRTMLQWADYIALRRERETWGESDQYKVIEKLVIGGHILLLDKIKSGPSKDALMIEVHDFEQNLTMREKPSWKVFRYGTDHLTRDPRDPQDCRSKAINQSGFLRHWRLQLGSSTEETAGSFVLSPTAVANVARIICARDTGHPICLVGPPGIGKSKVVEVSAKVSFAALDRTHACHYSLRCFSVLCLVAEQGVCSHFLLCINDIG